MSAQCEHTICDLPGLRCQQPAGHSGGHQYVATCGCDLAKAGTS